jgi:CoA:oxalate CoA-transferase
MLLADLGADVVKVESSEHVDSSRLVVPYLGFADIERSAYFRFFNRNKRSIELDLGRQGDAVRELATGAHAVVENLRPGSLDGKALGYKQLRALRADLVMCSISGFGRSGPRSSWASYGGAMAECANGLAMATGGTRPISPGRALGDIFAGLYAALGVCAQLYEQARRKHGSYIEVTQFEAGASSLEEMLVLPPESAEEHQVIGSDAVGWRAVGPAGEWPVRDAGTVAAALDAAGAVQRFSTAEGEDTFVCIPALIEGERMTIRRRSPRLGEHSDEVLAEWLR